MQWSLIKNKENMPYNSKGKINWKDIRIKDTIRIDYIYMNIYNIYNFEVIEEVNKSSIKIKCIETNVEDYIATDKLKNKKIGKFTKDITRDYKYNIGQILCDNKRNLIILDREKRNSIHKKNTYIKWYKCLCNNCGWNECWIEESKIKKGSNCPCCEGRVCVKGINDIATVRPDLIKYFVNIEDAYTHTLNSNEEVLTRCIDCGYEKLKKICYLSERGFCCNQCTDKISYPNKFLAQFCHQLKELNEIKEYELEYCPDYLGKKRNDACLTLLNEDRIVVEMDGGLGHEGGVQYRKAKRTLEESIRIDNWKEEQNLLHKIKTIRINCFKSEVEYIKSNIINSELNKLFDISKIDWKKCEEFARKNLIKEICILYSNYVEEKKDYPSLADFKKFYNISFSNSTISVWLKIGNNIGWCIYKPKIVKPKNSKEHCRSKSVICIDIYNKTNRIWHCARDAEREYGISSNNISRYCRGIRKSPKGFLWFFLEEWESLTEEEKVKRIKTKIEEESK